jgi:hypothetical protein
MPFLVQWISSERAGQSVGDASVLLDGRRPDDAGLRHRKREPVIIIGQSLATIIYIRNIMLIVRNRGSASRTLDRRSRVFRWMESERASRF